MPLPKDSQGHVDPDEYESENAHTDAAAELAPEPADGLGSTPARPPDTREESASATERSGGFIDHVGFTEGGLTAIEAATLVGVSIASFTLAGYILNAMYSHGFHHAPWLLWAIFALLIVTPLILAFGTAAGTAVLATLHSSGETESGHDREARDEADTTESR